MAITALFGNSPRMKVVEFFLDFPKDRFTIPDLIEGIGMSKTTARNQVDELLENEWIIEMPKVGKSPTYQINLDNPLVKHIQKMNSFESEKTAIKELQKKSFNSVRKLIQEQLALSLVDSELQALTTARKNREQREQIIKSISMKVAKIGETRLKEMEKEIEAQ